MPDATNDGPELLQLRYNCDRCGHEWYDLKAECETDDDCPECGQPHNSPVNDADDEPDEDCSDLPEDDDYTTADHQRFYQSGKLVLVVPPDGDHVAALRAHMGREQFWPNAWFVSDHGNAHRIEFPPA